MKTLSFANNDTIPALGLGTWKSTPGEVENAVIEAIKIGFRHIDCAAIYGNEKEIGRALKEVIDRGIVKREELFITSKLWNNMHGYDDVEIAIKQSLADLQLEYLDLYLIHWPVAHKRDIVNPKVASDFESLTNVPLIETWEGMIKVKELGLCRHIGVSNFSISKLQSLLVNTRMKPEMNQVESHPYLHQKNLKTFCDLHEILFTAYSPLGSRDRENEHAPDLFNDPLIQKIALQKGISSAQVLIAWAINRDTVVIPKTVTPSRMTENFAAADIELTVDEMTSLNELNQDFRYIDGSFWIKENNGYSLYSLWG
jgi:alcohol dehydrogenase (NADP+)